MNKYQEALDYIKRIEFAFVSLTFQEDEIEKLLHENIQLLQELVDKETPTKPNFISDGYVYDDEYEVLEVKCPNCGEDLDGCYNHRRCPECGQALDWSEVDEKDEWVDKE